MSAPPTVATLADAIATVSLLALGDRSKLTPDAAKLHADALCGLLEGVASALVCGLEVPMVPAAEALCGYVRDIDDNHDHDPDAHRYGTRCYVCEAEKLLGKRGAK